VSRKARAGRFEQRDPAIDAFGALLFGSCGEALARLTTEEECASEPSYMRLRALVDGRKELQLDEVFGNYYRSDAKLLNHTDGDNVLFSMTAALGKRNPLLLIKINQTRQLHLSLYDLHQCPYIPTLHLLFTDITPKSQPLIAAHYNTFLPKNFQPVHTRGIQIALRLLITR